MEVIFSKVMSELPLLFSNSLYKPKDLNISTHLRLSTQICEVLKMKRFTVSVPKELKEELDSIPDINWPEVVKEGLREKLAKLEKLKELENKGEL